jgi:hypothetical protein
MAVGPEAFAQYQPAPQRLPFSQLERLVAPIALYPDPLLAQVLAAATYAEQIPEAALWADRHSYLRSDELRRAALEDHLPWEPSVQSLIPFPSVLDMMSRDVAWTNDLGNAVLAQRDELMDAIQSQRRLALDSGYLRSTPQIRVVNSRFIEIQPLNPAILYVPFYDPRAVFSARRSGGYGRGITFSAGVPIAGAFAAWGWGPVAPRFGWDTHTVIIGRGPWNRTWSNRQSYEHPYADVRDRRNAAARAEEHRLLQPDEQYYRRQREQQGGDRPGSGLGHINQDANRPK